MALDQSVLSELLDAFRTGEGLDLVREAVTLVCQELIEAELTAVIGADRYERTAARTTERNGHRPRVLSTKAGDVELAIPKLRKGSFFPSILEPRRRIDQALYAVVMEAYVHGVSTRAVDELVAALGVSAGISKSEVSRICGELDEVVASFRERRLDHVGFPYVYLDATYLHVRENHQVTSKAVVIATGVSATGHREILGIDVGDSENEVFWREFLRRLRARGLEGVRLVISDQHAGLVAAIKRCFQGASHQRCRVHFARNLLAMIPKGHQAMVSAAFKTVFAQVSGPDMHAQWDQVTATLEERFGKAAALLREAKEEVLAFTAFPSEHWRQIWSTNPLERLNKELKRRCRVVGIFPNEASVIRLGGAVLLDVHDEWVATERRYFSEASMAKLYAVGDNDDATVGELTPSG
ncbi:MAG TPA: IS256 family transposase [Acidimicrobiales bacterium]|jgi:transposase-like protein|nr:IS256 family transposase [Acidimicrobiales bacterium]